MTLNSINSTISNWCSFQAPNLPWRELLLFQCIILCFTANFLKRIHLPINPFALQFRRGVISYRQCLNVGQRLPSKSRDADWKVFIRSFLTCNFINFNSWPCSTSTRKWVKKTGAIVKSLIPYTLNYWWSYFCLHSVKLLLLGYRVIVATLIGCFWTTLRNIKFNFALLGPYMSSLEEHGLL